MRRVAVAVAAAAVLAGCEYPQPAKFESDYPVPTGYESVVVQRCDDRDVKDPSKVSCAEPEPGSNERYIVTAELAPNGSRKGPKVSVYVCGRQSPDNPCIVPHDTPRGNRELKVTLYYRTGHNPLVGEPL